MNAVVSLSDKMSEVDGKTLENLSVIEIKHELKKRGYFSVIHPPPPPHQKIRKTVEIVPEKMKKSSIEIVQILVLSKYN